VILDVMLPVLDGFTVLRQLRRQSTVPVIMLTARAAEQDRVGGLGEGADDYLVKPFAAAELLARIRAVLRRTFQRPDPAPSVVQVGDLRVDALNRAVSFRGVPIELTPTELTILEVLMRAVGRIVSRDELTGVLYQRQTTPYERSLDVHVSHLRRKLEDVGWNAIRTVRGQGYVCVTDA
jgi:two-component system response regulator CpxR